MTELRLAFAFLTRLPVGEPTGGAAAHARASRYFGLTGAVIAVHVVLAVLAGAWFFDRGVACVLAIGVWAVLSGGLHLDGLADCIDGLSTNGTAGRRLQAMHDPRIGGLGAVGLVLWLALKGALLSRCIDAGTVAQAVWCAAVFARAPLAFELSEGEPATPGRGLFAWLHPEVRRPDWLIAVLLGAVLLLPAALPGGMIAARVVVGVVIGALVTLAWHLLWYRRIGGLSGDVLGGAVELREGIMLGAMAAQLPWG